MKKFILISLFLAACQMPQDHKLHVGDCMLERAYRGISLENIPDDSFIQIVEVGETRCVAKTKDGNSLSGLIRTIQAIYVKTDCPKEVK